MDPKLLTGTMEMMILDVLARGDSYGYQLAQTVLNSSGELFDLKEGSLYPALHRMQRRKLLRSYWVNTQEGRRRKYYKLTPQGRQVLKTKRKEWRQFRNGVEGVLGRAYVVA